MTFILRLGFCVPSSIPFRSPAGASSMLLIFKELFLAFTSCYFTKFCFSLHQPVPSGSFRLFSLVFQCRILLLPSLGLCLKCCSSCILQIECAALTAPQFGALKDFLKRVLGLEKAQWLRARVYPSEHVGQFPEFIWQFIQCTCLQFQSLYNTQTYI